MTIDKMAKRGGLDNLTGLQSSPPSPGKGKNSGGETPMFEALVAGQRDTGNERRQDRRLGEPELNERAFGRAAALRGSGDIGRVTKPFPAWDNVAVTAAPASAAGAAEPSDPVSHGPPAPLALFEVDEAESMPTQEPSRRLPETAKDDFRGALPEKTATATSARIVTAPPTSIGIDSVFIEEPQAQTVTRTAKSPPDIAVPFTQDHGEAAAPLEAEIHDDKFSGDPSTAVRAETEAGVAVSLPTRPPIEDASLSVEVHAPAVSASTDLFQVRRNFGERPDPPLKGSDGEAVRLPVRPEVQPRSETASVSPERNPLPRLAEQIRGDNPIEASGTAASTAESATRRSDLEPVVFRSGRLELAKELPITKVAVVDAQTHFLGSLASRRAAELVSSDATGGLENGPSEPVRHPRIAMKDGAEHESDLRLDLAPDRFAVTAKSGGRSETAVGLAQQVLPGIGAELKQMSRESSQPSLMPSAVTPGAPPATAGSTVRVLTIELAPRDLGSIKVELTLRGEQLSVRIDTQSDEAVARLEEVKPGLTKALQASGYSIEELILQRNDAKFELMEAPLRHGANDGSDGRAAQQSQGGLQHGAHESGQQPRRGHGAPQNDMSATAEPGDAAGSQSVEAADGLRDVDGVRRLIV